MSKIVAAAAIHGSHAVVAEAEQNLNHATTLGRAREVLDIARDLLTSRGKGTGRWRVL